MFENEPKPLYVKGMKQEVNENFPAYWFKRENGETFCVNEVSAWELLKGRSVVKGKPQPRLVYLGFSDSKDYFEGMKKVKEVFKVDGLEKAQEMIRELHEAEALKANNTIRPRNFDTIGFGKNPVNVAEMK